MSERVEQDAAIWAVRHPLTPADRRALDAWLAQDLRYPGALLRAQAALSRIDDALAPAPAFQPILPADTVVLPARRRVLAGLGGAVAAVAAGVVGWPHWWGDHIATARGEIRRLPLADGSVATLDSETELRVALARSNRRITLARGEAWFQVAKDRHRPFIVDAGMAQARAVGTAFSVRRTVDGVQIAVTEGTVAVWATDASGAMGILHQGQYATFRNGAAMPETGTAPAAIERSLAWREGEIALEGDTLSSAVARFNLYNRQQLIVADEVLGRERLVGLFRIDHPADFAATLAATLDVAVTTTGDEIRLHRKKMSDE